MTTDKRAAAIAALIVRDVAEIPDRCSPDDQPEMMLVTSGELTDIVMRRLAALEADDGRALRDTALSITGAIGGTRREDWDDTVPVPTGKLFRLRDLLAASEQPAPLCSECGDPMPVPLAHCCEKPEQPAPEPAAPHADDEARIAEILRKHAKGWTENDRLLIDDALLLATDTIRDLAAGKAKAEAELAAVDAAIADRGVPERDCSLPLPERVSNIISELKNWRHEAGTAQVEVERLRGRDAEPFDWDAAPSVQEWIDENLPEREPRAGSKMVELHPDEVIADRGESRRVAGWLKDLMAENADLRAKLAEAEKQRDAIVRDRDWWEKQYGTVAAAVIAASGLDESHGWDAALDSMKRRHAAVLAQRDAALADHTALARQELLSLACEFPVAWTLKGAQVIERISARIAALRAAKPEPAAEPVPAAADAKRNTDDEVLRDMLCEALPVQLHDVVHCLRVLCRRALEVRKRPDADAKPGDEVLRKVWDALRNTPHASVSLEQQKWCIAVERVVCELVERALEVRP